MKKFLIQTILFILIGTISIAEISASEPPLVEQGNKPYLLLVTFYTKHSFLAIDDAWLTTINKTPYDGIAVMLTGAYNTDLITATLENKINAKIKEIKQKTNKDIWPWIFFNRFIGGELKANRRKHMSSAAISHFGSIPGIDIYDQTGALSDFKHQFRMALRFSKKIGSPGIVVDPEAYNNYGVYNTKNLEKLMQQPSDIIQARLKTVGRELARIVKEEYPQAVLWFLFIKHGLSTTYITEGILDEALEKSIPLKIIEGGETNVGYVNRATSNENSAPKRNLILLSQIFQNLIIRFCLSYWSKSVAAGTREKYLK
jgi:hypothetical protein